MELHLMGYLAHLGVDALCNEACNPDFLLLLLSNSGLHEPNVVAAF